MKTAGEIIETIMKKMKNTNGFKRFWLETNWCGLAGTEANNHSRPHRIEKENLYVNVDSSAWNYNLFMNKALLIKKINQRFGCLIVKDIKYQVCEIKNEQADDEDGLKLINETVMNDDFRYNTYLSGQKIIICLKKRINKMSTQE